MSKLDVGLLGRGGSQVHVVGLGPANGRLVAESPPARSIVMSDKDAGGVGQRIQPIVDRIVKALCARCGKVTSPGPEVLDEERVTREHCVGHPKAQASRRVPWRRDDVHAKTPGFEAVVVAEQAIELPAIDTKVVAELEHALERGLYLRDARANSDGRRERSLEQPRSRQVVRVRMRLQDPSDGEVLLVDEGEYLVCGSRVGAPRRRVEVEDGIDDDGIAGRGVVDDVRQGRGIGVVECVNVHGEHLAHGEHGACLDPRRVGVALARLGGVRQQNDDASDTLDPSDWAHLREQGHRMLDDMFDHLQNLRAEPVWRPIPPEVRERIHEPLPRAPTDLAVVHSTFLESVLPFAVGNAHPGFMGWVHGGGTPVGMLAEMLAAGLNANLGGRDQMPVEVERQIVAWVRTILGFPDSASGLFVTGSSMANLLAVLVARTSALGVGVRQAGVGRDGNGLTAYASSAAHRCIAQAMDLSGLGIDALRIVPTNGRHEVDVAALEDAVQADKRAGRRPFFVAATAGTVDVGAIDDLMAVADVAHREGLWFHVDGAYGALAMLAPDIAPRLAGIERADSVALDFHKWAQVPYDAGFVLVRDSALHQATFDSPAAYLRRETRGLAAGSPWPSDFGPDLSRGFRALKTWFTLKVYGTDKLGRMMSHCCALAQHLGALIEASPELELLAPVSLNIVCFRYRSRDADRVNREIVIALHESGIAAPSTTLVNGSLAIRAALFNHRTTREDLDKLMEATRRIGRALCKGEGSETR